MGLFEDINIGALIRQKITEKNIESVRICNFLKCTEKEIGYMYSSKNMSTELLLKWSKLLEYDFFRIYTQHLILYTPSGLLDKKECQKKSKLPVFRKNIYTKEVVDFILELIESGEKTKVQIIKEYNIPKTTLHKWTYKYRN